MTARREWYRHAHKRRRGSALIEFAVVFFLIYILVGGVLVFGRMLFSAQTVNQAVDAASRELARTPLPPTATFEDVRDSTAPPTDFRTRVYSEDWLAINITPWVNAPGGLTLYEYLDTLPIPLVNRHLIPVMFMQQVGNLVLLRYPGALVTSATAPSTFSVEVPVVLSEDYDGNMSIRWVRVLEEIDTEDQPGDNTGPNPDAFPVNSPQGGVAALRLNYPFQSVMFSEWVGDGVIVADDSAVTAVNSPNGTPVDPGGVAGPYEGQFGLGRQFVLGTEVRPYRRLVSAQAVYRREVFE